MLWNFGPFALKNWMLAEGVVGWICLAFIGKRLREFLTFLLYFGLAAVGLLILGMFSIYKWSGFTILYLPAPYYFLTLAFLSVFSDFLAFYK
jgi:hypothetical protein|tara:strand:- start:887 stop:1162 length:276 start_codon:yes stop_codon:yes gene_type:complete